MAELTCYIALNSPWSFLGGDRVHRLAARFDLDVDVRPIDAGQVFPASGGLPLPRRAPQRQAYRLIELDRWRKFLDIPLVLQPKHFPSPEAVPAALVVAARLAGQDSLALATAFGAAIWVEDRDFSAESVQRDLMTRLGLDADALLAAAAGDEVRDELARHTREAMDIGVFGMPTYVYRDEMFWGQDRIDFLTRTVEASRAS